VHAGDADSHQQSAAQQPAQAQSAMADRVERKARHDGRDKERQQRDGYIERHRNRQLEGQHADEVHRPDAGPHGESAAEQPVARGPGSMRHDARRKVKRHVGCDGRDYDRKKN